MTNLSYDLVAATVGLCTASLLILWRHKTSSNPPLPPGPKRLPILGNFFDMPTSNEWLVYEKWAKDFGEP